MKIFDNGTLRDATAEEETRIKAERALEPSSAERKLAKIRELRLQKLQATVGCQIQMLLCQTTLKLGDKV